MGCAVFDFLDLSIEAFVFCHQLLQTIKMKTLNNAFSSIQTIKCEFVRRENRKHQGMINQYLWWKR